LVELVPGGQRLAFTTEGLAEIVDEPRLAVLPMADPRILGVGNLRGSPLPVLDTAAILGLDGGSFSADDQRLLLVLVMGSRRVGLRVHRVIGMMTGRRLATDQSRPGWCDAVIVLGADERETVPGVSLTTVRDLVQAIAKRE
jgi:chemotaxis signal transduction protein